jgi:NAD(P)-dependent dehydrogenase (short-subunit alcohol dehydrogenase family)
LRPVCLITGASGRLGEVLSGNLSSSYDVIAVYRTQPPKLDSQLFTRVPPVGDHPFAVGTARAVHCVQADLRENADIRRLVEVGLARFGQIDCIINAAADTRFLGKLSEAYDQTSRIADQIHLNCISPITLISEVFQQCWKHDVAANGKTNRCVVNVSSISGRLVGKPRGQGFYAASKAALNMLTMHLAIELAQYSIRVNGVSPSRFSSEDETRAVASLVASFLAGDMTGEIASPS